MYTQLLSERDSFAATPLYPASTNGQSNTGAVDMSKFNRVVFKCLLGSVPGGANVQLWLQQGNLSNGASGFNIAQVTGGGNIATGLLTQGSAEVALEVAASQLATNCRYVKCTVNVTGIASLLSVTPVGTEARYGPANASDFDSANTTYVNGN